MQQSRAVPGPEAGVGTRRLRCAGYQRDLRARLNDCSNAREVVAAPPRLRNQRVVQPGPDLRQLIPIIRPAKIFLMNRVAAAANP